MKMPLSKNNISGKGLQFPLKPLSPVKTPSTVRPSRGDRPRQAGCNKDPSCKEFPGCTIVTVAKYKTKVGAIVTQRYERISAVGCTLET